jgi:hypothetical protein
MNRQNIRALCIALRAAGPCIASLEDDSSDLPEWRSGAPSMKGLITRSNFAAKSESALWLH